MTSIDTNVIVALWDRDAALSSAAQRALEHAASEGTLIISAPVFAELIAAPGRTESFVDAFLYDTGMMLDWEINEKIWRLAGRAFQRYAAKQRKQKLSGPRRILADFLIGAHAFQNRHKLLTLDQRLYRGAFPELAVTEI
ncbi:MAG TPA: type II toxin-antitoxin system VapC family toxin [Terriglobales bacterium]|nr:type II toxin-antitoxin system VapC family toxin [Terriglobales bacterium]